MLHSDACMSTHSTFNKAANECIRLCTLRGSPPQKIKFKCEARPQRGQVDRSGSRDEKEKTRVRRRGGLKKRTKPFQGNSREREKNQRGPSTQGGRQEEQGGGNGEIDWWTVNSFIFFFYSQKNILLLSSVGLTA
mmetsp:Transcript_33390/g.66211  ORF Transcript_33390/g.66211 Transcript_33390/m.66211 type:complete len:135 (+) Transcript_33390:136-540(+)